MTRGFTPTQVRLIRIRDHGLCAWHGRSCDPETLVPNHRANRGMGGRRSANTVANGLLLCSLVNGLIESDEEWAEQAYERGIKISTYWDPEQVPVRYIDGWWLPEGNIRRHLRDDEAAELMALHGIRIRLETT